MKEVFQMLKDPRFHLVYGVTQRYSNGPEPRRVRLNREGYKLVEGVTKKALVYPRMRLAVHPSPLKGDAFSPIFGRITDVTERSLFVEAIEPDEALRALADGVEKVDLINDERTGQELAVLLKSLGLNTKSLGQSGQTGEGSGLIDGKTGVKIMGFLRFLYGKAGKSGSAAFLPGKRSKLEGFHDRSVLLSLAWRPFCCGKSAPTGRGSAPIIAPWGGKSNPEDEERPRRSRAVQESGNHQPNEKKRRNLTA